MEEWLGEIQRRLEGQLEGTATPSSLPPLPPESFVEACRKCRIAYEQYCAAEQYRKKVAKEADNPTLVQTAAEAFVQAQDEWNGTSQICRDEAQRVLKSGDYHHFLSVGYDDRDLMSYAVICQVGLERCIDWCAQSDSMIRLLKHRDDGILRRFLQAGGPRNHQYLRALDIYQQLDKHHDNEDIRSVLDRLAMSVALELCEPTKHFDTNIDIDPIARFDHYRKAFLEGDLDPAFETFSVWELRHVINCDATNEQLEWGRQCLQNYRPDLVYSLDPKWRYNMVVKTDVPHKTPFWYKEPRSYDQILSGGGKCGPRAWYGRFICKAFGMPTWGAKQPGHAAMSRWTPDGWVTCLGAAFKWNSWDGRCGLDFELESKARLLLIDDSSYQRMVLRLEWLALYQKEVNSKIRSTCTPDPSNPLLSLALMQRQLIVENTKDMTAKGSFVPKISKNNKIHSIMDKTPSRPPISINGQGVIVIPAASTTAPEKPARSIAFLKSFLDDSPQLSLGQGSVEYKIDHELLGLRALTKKFFLTISLCTVHRDDDPLIIFVQNGGSEPDEIKINAPYTMGMWASTHPISFELIPPETVLKVTRTRKEFAIAVKELRLSPA